MKLSKTIVRRFILGKQGLWPGRRWSGLQGTAQAIQSIEAVQMDPLNVIARSHDIVLWSRVLDYQPAHLDLLMYQQRAFFDYGGGLFLYPISELPYWQLHMQRRKTEGRWADFAHNNQPLLEQVRSALRDQGPLGNRDFTGNQRVNSYRGRKDTALALFYLWLTGELMIHHRNGFDRIYDFRERVAPAEFDYAASETETIQYFARKTVSFLGLVREKGWNTSLADYLYRRIDQEEARQLLKSAIDEGLVAPVQIEDSKETWYVLTSDLPVLASLQEEKIPETWRPMKTDTSQETVFLAPLDIVGARGRAARLFDFEYVWEVYKPAAQRRWGYYTLPILYEDRLVARLDPKLERNSHTMVIKGLWLEDAQSADEAFLTALSQGLTSFARFVQASQVDLQAIDPPELRKNLQHLIASQLATSQE